MAIYMLNDRVTTGTWISDSQGHAVSHYVSPPLLLPPVTDGMSESSAQCDINYN